MFDDIREFIKRVKELEGYKLVEGADWDLEIGAITHIMIETPDSPLVLFDNIKGYQAGYRVVSNMFTTPRRTALALGLPLVDLKGLSLVRAWRDRLREEVKLVSPAVVKTGPVKENILTGDAVDLYKFPAPKWHELDGGRYIGTGCMVIQRDPDEGWVNVGTYRVQVHDKTTATVYMAPGRHGDIIQRKYWDKGLPCPVAVSCGQEPALWAASTWSIVPWGVSEYEYAGGLKNKPIEVVKGEVTDLPIPARAELVLEGDIVPPEVEVRQEGPFAEWLGYYGYSRPVPAFKVKAILHRNNPIIMGAPPFKIQGRQIFNKPTMHSALTWNELDRQVPGVKGVWIAEEAATSILIISIEQKYPGHAKQVALAAAGINITGYMVRIVIVVDDDIDPSNISDVLWALGTRWDPATSTDIIDGCWGSLIDPRLSPEKKNRGDLTHSKAIILACKPYHWMKEFAPAVTISPELLKRVKDKGFID
ncbi:MAG: UbiD family decarboxylase [Chloroflexi bacterium]|nr:UbiD family decarboxylase [Chloroflexota bacterium]